MVIVRQTGLCLGLLSWIPILARAATYPVLLKEYSGSTFFNDWDFYGSFDNLTNGDVDFISASEAGGTDSLAYVDPSTGRAIIKVDNTTAVPWNEKRKAVRITTKESFDIGSVIVADFHHAPYGCSVWPSFWTLAGAEEWPVGGEIDIFEGINMATRSQMGLHTPPGCSQSNPRQLTTEVRSTDCAGENNAGCIVANTDPASYGRAFAAAGGGVFITEFAETGISIWFFTRGNIPPSITSTSQSVDTSTLGTPMGHWPSTGCNISEFFKPQNLILTITLCGDFAKPPEIFQQTCEGMCYEDYVIKDASHYATAYFDIASIRVFSNDTDARPSGSNSPSSSTSAGGGSQTDTPGSAISSQLSSVFSYVSGLVTIVAVGMM